MFRWIRWGATISLAAMFAVAVGFGSALYTWQRLTHEQEVAQLSFTQLAPQRFQVTLTLADQSSQTLELEGDEWQLDVRMIKWRGTAILSGMDPLYQLDRLSGRYRDIEQARSTLPSIIALNDNPVWDLWQTAREHPDWLPWLDAAYGSSVYLPMDDKAGYQVNLGLSGLIARPIKPS